MCLVEKLGGRKTRISLRQTRDFGRIAHFDLRQMSLFDSERPAMKIEFDEKRFPYLHTGRIIGSGIRA